MLIKNARRTPSALITIAAAAVLVAFPAVNAIAQPTPTAPALEAAPQSSAMSNSVVTVDDLLKTENLQAVAKARKAAIAAGLMQPDAPVTAAGSAAVPAATLHVDSISGIGSALRANLHYNGQAYESIRPGAHIGKCVVLSINGRAVKFARAARGTPASQCPSAVWTGELPVASGGPGGATETAMPSPAFRNAPIPYGSISSMSNLAHRSPSGPAPLRVSQPTIQMVPAEQSRAEGGAVPLVPRQLEPAQDMRLATPPAGQPSE
ncbi:MAG: hypothetical protein EPN79_10875 [Burkholderiaceae bacterium]|nr:MAG: hypothetical protein EPN79_10875 [Burkholderiaceae bacterium]TBR76812.1 MAG: hypothetical protein EPN64_06200 [Burkholderiaceae bacterium]